MLNAKQLHTLRQRWSVDLAMNIENTRVRINVFYTTRGLSLAIRLLPEVIPELSLLNLHPSLQQIKDQKAGLILVCGSTGSGKTTTIAAIIEEINRSRPVHIITIEDPIEYRFRSKRAFIEQREVGIHCPSFKQGLIDVLRENPDIIFIGELREPETIRLTLNAAESGHLVFASLHAQDVEDAVYRINNALSGTSQEIIRYQFAATLSWLIVQQLITIEKVPFRVPVLSILKGTISVKNIIRENRLNQLESAMQTGKGDGMFTMDRYLNEFLATKESFTRPYRPLAQEEPKEEDYKSALIDPHAIQDVIYTATVGLDLPTAEEKPKEKEVSEIDYVIEETPDLEDILSQLNMKEL